MSLDLGAISAAHFFAWKLRFGVHIWGHYENPTASGPYGLAAIISSLVMFALIIAGRLHDEDTLFRGSREFGRVLKATCQTMILFPALAYFSHTRAISRMWMLLSLLFAMALVSGERVALRWYVTRRRRSGSYRRPAIIIEEQDTKDPLPVSSEFHVIDRLDAETGISFLDSIRDSLSDRPLKPVSVIVLAKGLDDDLVWQTIMHAGHAGCPVYVESPVRSVAPDRMTVRPFGSRTVMRVAPPALSGLQAILKRSFDIAVAGASLIVLSPFLAIIAASVLATSGRPFFYGQERVGRDGKRFKIWKFRTMRPNSESKTGPVWASQDDPRRTPIGKFLRTTSIDELPQLWNVLRGEMSLVGPRPERPNFVTEFAETIPWYPYRHRMRPGITGWAQAHGLRGNTPLPDRVSYDNYYIENYSLGLDVKICLLTLAELLRGDHAY